MYLVFFFKLLLLFFAVLARLGSSFPKKWNNKYFYTLILQSIGNLTYFYLLFKYIHTHSCIILIVGNIISTVVPSRREEVFKTA